MKKPLDPVEARQARQGRPVLIILGVSMVLALIAAGVMWGAYSDEDSTAFMNPDADVPVTTEPGIAVGEEPGAATTTD